MEETEKDEIKDLIVSVFDNPEGHKLLEKWMHTVGITRFVGAPDEEGRIRLEERRLFVFSILKHMAYDPNSFRETIISGYTQKNIASYQQNNY